VRVPRDLHLIFFTKMPTKIFIGTPCYGGMITADYFKSCLRLVNEAPKHDIALQFGTVGNESLVTRARNTLVQLFMDDPGNYTHLLFIDADIGFSEKTVFRMVDLDKDVVTQIPEFQDETAAFIMLNALQQAAGGIALNRSNIKNPTTLINNLMRDAVIDTKQLVRDAEDMGIAANQAQIDRARNIQNLKARNPELSEAELKVLYPDLFKEVEVPISGELGVNPTEETILARQNQIFNARLTEATNRLLEPTVDFVNKRNAINQNTRNFLRASRGLNVLSGDAPTATNPNI